MRIFVQNFLQGMNNTSPPSWFFCKFCDDSFPRQVLLILHEKKRHPDASLSQSDGDKFVQRKLEEEVIKDHRVSVLPVSTITTTATIATTPVLKMFEPQFYGRRYDQSEIVAMYYPEQSEALNLSMEVVVAKRRRDSSSPVSSQRVMKELKNFAENLSIHRVKSKDDVFENLKQEKVEKDQGYQKQEEKRDGGYLFEDQKRDEIENDHGGHEDEEREEMKNCDSHHEDEEQEKMRNDDGHHEVEEREETEDDDDQDQTGVENDEDREREKQEKDDRHHEDQERGEAENDHGHLDVEEQEKMEHDDDHHEDEEQEKMENDDWQDQKDVENDDDQAREKQETDDDDDYDDDQSQEDDGDCETEDLGYSKISDSSSLTSSLDEEEEKITNDQSEKRDHNHSSKKTVQVEPKAEPCINFLDHVTTRLAGAGKKRVSYSCNFCGRNMYKMPEVKEHISLHIDIPNFPCERPNCTKSFSSQYDQQRHQARHVKRKKNVLTITSPTSQQQSSGTSTRDAISRPDDNSNSSRDLDQVDYLHRYCTCNRIAFGQMVACDQPSCPRKWFHFECVGLTEGPKKHSRWYCSQCATSAVPRKRRSAGKGWSSRRRRVKT